MPDFSQLGTSFVPNGDPTQMRRRQQSQGEALRVLAMTLPQVLGPGTVAPDILLNSQGGAPGITQQSMTGGPPQGQASPMASMIAESVINQVLGQPGAQGDPQAGYRAQIAPQSPIAPPPVGPGTSLNTQSSLSNTVRQEAANPSAQVAVGGGQGPPSISGAAQLPTMPGGQPGPSVGPPRVLPGDTPDMGGQQPQQPGNPGTQQSLTDMGAILEFLRSHLGQQGRSPTNLVGYGG